MPEFESHEENQSIEREDEDLGVYYGYDADETPLEHYESVHPGAYFERVEYQRRQARQIIDDARKNRFKRTKKIFKVGLKVVLAPFMIAYALANFAFLIGGGIVVALLVWYAISHLF